MKFVVTAGPTREHLDPVRFLSNPSTGKMGFAVARAAARAGHDVTLVAGPVALATPKGVARVDAVSARDVLAAVEAALAAVKDAPDGVALVMTAAVADWRPATCAAKKLKKSAMSGTLKLVRNPDVLKTVRAKTRTWKRKPVLVGFAAETGEPTAEAARKCREKGLAMVVANDVTQPGAGFGVDTNRVTFVLADGTLEPLPLMTKDAVARRIVEKCRTFGGGGGI
ncbi:MAG: hypothetical protein MJ138_07165 [Kiritimatiellae bacterium]|nr:hypothetical protein [Kiritimatiellia bacterium]